MIHALILVSALAFDGKYITEYGMDGHVVHRVRWWPKHKYPPAKGIYCEYSDEHVAFVPKRTDWVACPMVRPNK